MKARLLMAAATCAALALPALAQDKPMPKMFQGMAKEKGQWRVDVLEGGGASGKAPPSMTICTDNLMNQNHSGAKDAKPKSECKQRLLKDTSSEAIVETTCKDRVTTVTMKRENDKSVLMQMDSKGTREQHMKMRYTHLGACRAGQGTITLDKNSEQCKQLREQAAKMDPQQANRLLAMCN